MYTSIEEYPYSEFRIQLQAIASEFRPNNVDFDRFLFSSALSAFFPSASLIVGFTVLSCQFCSQLLLCRSYFQPSSLPLGNAGWSQTNQMTSVELILLSSDLISAISFLFLSFERIRRSSIFRSFESKQQNRSRSFRFFHFCCLFTRSQVPISVAGFANRPI